MKGIKADLELKLINPSGKVVMTKKIPCHTFLKNFAELAWIALFMRGDVTNAATVTLKDSSTKQIKSSYSLSVLGFIVSPSYKCKCRIGTGTQAFNRTDVDVQTYLAEIAYSQFELNDTGAQKTLTITFSWLNDTGASKDVTEACLFAYFNDSGDVKFYMALTRDVFSAVTVGDGYTLAIGYTITFPW